MNNAPKRDQAPPKIPDMRRPGGGGGPMGARVNAEKPKNTWNTLLRLIKYIGKNKLLVIALVAVIIFPASRLQRSRNADRRSLAEIAGDKLCRLSPSNAVDKVCLRIALSVSSSCKSAIYCK